MAGLVVVSDRTWWLVGRVAWVLKWVVWWAGGSVGWWVRGPVGRCVAGSPGRCVGGSVLHVLQGRRRGVSSPGEDGCCWLLGGQRTLGRSFALHMLNSLISSLVNGGGAPSLAGRTLVVPPPRNIFFVAI